MSYFCVIFASDCVEIAKVAVRRVPCMPCCWINPASSRRCLSEKMDSQQR